MRVSWRERLDRQPHLWAMDRWPQLSLDTIPRDRRQAFLRNRQIVAQVLAGQPLGEVAQHYRCSAGRISQLLDRCLGGEADQAPALTRALVPYSVVRDKQRQSPLPALSAPQGPGCAFLELLDAVPGLRDGLDAMILAKLKDKATAQRVTPQSFHGTFKRLLAEAHWPPDQYPYTTASLAYESVRRYLHQRTTQLQRERLARRQRRPRDLGIAASTRRALRVIQIDEQTVDTQEKIYLWLNDELIPLRLPRLSVLLAADVDTHCVLGYHLALSGTPNQQDMLTLLDNCLQPWRPLTLTTPGLAYTPGAAFPSGLEEAPPISFGRVQLDNAKIHRALSVIDLLGHQFGATLSWGLPGMPKVRQLVESVFDYINKHCTHRVAATTGSYPTDPKKESRKNRKRMPAITVQMLNEALSVILTEYNITPQAALGNTSPLALFQHHGTSHFVRHVPQRLRDHIHPMLSTQEVALHWYSDERRQPHVNFHYARYQGPGLLKVAGQEKQIRVQFDRRDIRTLRAMTLAGEDLGELQVSQSWQRFPHSLATRQRIHKVNKQHRLNVRDPLSSYFQHLLKHKDTPTSMLGLVRVYSEFTRDITGPLALGEETAESQANTKNSSRTMSKRRWRTDLANQRK